MKITTEGSVHSIFQTSEQRPIEIEAVNNKSSLFIHIGFFGSREVGCGGKRSAEQCLPACLTFVKDRDYNCSRKTACEERTGQAR